MGDHCAGRDSEAFFSVDEGGLMGLGYVQAPPPPPPLHREVEGLAGGREGGRMGLGRGGRMTKGRRDSSLDTHAADSSFLSTVFIYSFFFKK